MSSSDDKLVFMAISQASTGVERGGPAAASSWRHRATMPTLVCVAVLVALISSLGAPLIPSIARADGVSLSTAEWLLTAALLTGAVATPIMGRLADGPRKRRVIQASLLAVAAGCVVSALSSGFGAMVVGRGLQGVGLGLLPVTMAVARSELPDRRVGRAVGTLSVTAAVGAGLGYPLTGLISQALGFRAAFWFGAIAVTMALIVASVVLPDRSTSSPRTLDLFGAVSLGLAVIGITALLSEAGDWGWTSLATLTIAIGSLAMVAIWVRHELHVADPLVDIRQVRNRDVLTADVSGLLIAVAMYLLIPIVVEFVQVPAANGYGFGASIALSGLVLVPLSISSFLASRCLGAYERRFGTRSMIPLGSLVFALSTLFFAFEHRWLWEAFFISGLAGIAIGFTFAAMPGFIVRAVPPGETGSATGFYQLLRSVGLSLGSALSAAILAAYTHHGHIYPTAEGFQITLLTASAICVGTAVLSYLLPGPPGRYTQPISEELEHLLEQEAEAAAVGLFLNDEALDLHPGRPEL
jgi:MFS family permease